MKKLASILLAILMIFMPIAAIAAAPSPTIDSLISIQNVVTQNYVGPTDFSMRIVENNELTISELKNLREYFENNNNYYLMGYYSKSLQKDLIKNLDVPLININNWTIWDYVTIELIGTYDEKMGNVMVSIRTVMPYELNQPCGTVLNVIRELPNKIKYEYYAISTVVYDVDEQYAYLFLTFTPQNIKKMEKGNALSLTVLTD